MKDMYHEVSIIPRILEILEVEVFNILHNPGNIGNWIFPIFLNPGNIGNIIFLYFIDLLSKTTRAEISRRMHRWISRDLSYETDSAPKTKTVSDPNFQVTLTATAACRQLSNLARPLDHRAQGPNIPFEVNPSLRCTCSSQIKFGEIPELRSFHSPYCDSVPRSP